MKWSTWRSRHRILFGTATSAAAVTLIAVGVPAAALATHPASHAGPSQIGPGYPPPGGIYAPFTNCPLLNPLMAESTPGNATGCVAGAGHQRLDHDRQHHHAGGAAGERAVRHMGSGERLGRRR